MSNQLTWLDLFDKDRDEEEEEKKEKEKDKKPTSDRRCPKCGREIKWISLALVCERCGIVG